MRRVLLLLSLSLSLSAFASPIITGVTPSSGPVAGGTTITITGTGFSDACAPTLPCNPAPAILVGSLLATNVHVVNETTITATTPAHLPGTFSVDRSQPTGSWHFENGFTFAGETDATFDRLLLPVYVPTTPGAFGSQFVTQLTLWNKGAAPLQVFGVTFGCPFLCPIDESRSTTLGPRDTTQTGFVPTGRPGAFVYVAKGRTDDLTGTLRVHDISRATETWGTDVPIVRERDFVSGVTGLVDIPRSPNFRQTLRVYAKNEGFVRVRLFETQTGLNFLSEAVVALRAGRDTYDPAYGEMATFPAGSGVTRIEIEPITENLRYWAFVSVTSNNFQHITTITPK
jgi:hypothetical protein